MSTNVGAVWVLALGALYSSASAGEAQVCDRDSKPKMTINTDREIFGIYYKSYGEDITLDCSIDDASTHNLKIEIDGKTLQVEELNSSVRFSAKKPNVGGYFYICKENKTGCKKSVAVEVRPALSVESPRVHQRRINEVLNFFVPLGEAYEVFCSSNRDGDGKDIHIYEDAVGRLPEEDINSTTIKHSALADRVEDRTVYCNRKVKELNRVVYEVINIIVDYFPECRNFQCFLRNLVNDFEVLECSWTYGSDKNTYILSYVDGNDYGESTVLCSDNSGKTVNTCTANEKLMSRNIFPYGKSVSLVLMTCNTIFCNHQTFIMNGDVIRKHELLYKQIKVLNISSRSVVLAWTRHSKTSAFKVEYRHEHWQQANTSSVSCRNYECEFELLLPYPDTSYEVRLSMRHKEATHEGSWSEPLTTLVYTTPRPKCNCDALQLLDTEKALCTVCTFVEDAVKVNLYLKKMKSAWKRKVAKIEALMELESLPPL